MNISGQCRTAPHHHQMENFPVPASFICNTHDSVSIPSDPLSLHESLCRRLPKRYKFASKQSYHVIAIMHVPMQLKCYSGQLALSSIAIAMGCGALMLQVMTLMSLRETYYSVESAFG